MFETLLDAGASFVPFLAAVILLALAVAVVRRVIDRTGSAGKTNPWRRQIATVLVVIFGLVFLVLTLPVAADTRGQLIGLLGVALTGIIAVSSTTFVTNAMAGLMLRILKNFKPGDWIQIGDNFGRVSEQGLLHTEIQTEDRDLTTIPNLLMVTQPVKVVHDSGTIVSATISLGYDAPRSQVKNLLIEAATEVGLSDPFVRVVELGDFSVTYRIGGFLEEVATLLAVRSRLRAAAMDALHQARIEIVSPTFMNQRPTTEPVFPPFESRADVPHDISEDIAFDKATRASRLALVESMVAERKSAIDEAKKRRKSPETSERADAENLIVRMESEIEALDQLIETLAAAGDE